MSTRLRQKGHLQARCSATGCTETGRPTHKDHAATPSQQYPVFFFTAGFHFPIRGEMILFALANFSAGKW
ncbi:MAG: hypothetical protein OEV89_10840 [Desulfobulbaceae bacterium]|nr:hypothetical protein [Desulfobulbaceae bacterium]HIJ91184.1 hypothetical protein [Deltaproteobacteria bacterium]